MGITKQAFAKINLTLDVLNKRDDGYHNIVSLMQSLSLSDTVTIERANTGIAVSWNRDERTGAANTACRAAEHMFRLYGLKGGLKIEIDKRIPISAGLGGGSADAAAVIEGLNELFGLKLGLKELMEAGAAIGADVPFCLAKGVALAEGYGEKIVRLDAEIKSHVVLVKPSIRISTKEVYAKIDSLVLARRPDLGMAAAAVNAGDLKNLGLNLFNVMEYVTAEEYPVIKRLKQEMAIQGAMGALMSGSGPTVYGVFERCFQAENAYSYFSNKYPDYNVLLCEFYYPE